MDRSFTAEEYVSLVATQCAQNRSLEVGSVNQQTERGVISWHFSVIIVTAFHICVWRQVDGLFCRPADMVKVFFNQRRRAKAIRPGIDCYADEVEKLPFVELMEGADPRFPDKPSRECWEAIQLIELNDYAELIKYSKGMFETHRAIDPLIDAGPGVKKTLRTKATEEDSA